MTDVIPMLSFLLFPDANPPCKSRRPSFGPVDAPEFGDIDDVDLSNVKPIVMIQLLSGEWVIHRRQKFEEEWQIARISFARQTFSRKRQSKRRLTRHSLSIRAAALSGGCGVQFDAGFRLAATPHVGPAFRPVPSGFAAFFVAPADAGLVGGPSRTSSDRFRCRSVCGGRPRDAGATCWRSPPARRRR
jgi:hypothetical protein